MAAVCDENFRRKRTVSSNSEEFLSEPLDVLVIPVQKRDGTQNVSPALSIGFMEPRSYVTYKVLPCLILPDEGTCDEADVEEWLERMTFLEEDLVWLLRLPHQRFWCQVLYDENLHFCLQSYLSRAPRDYDLNPSAREDILTHQKHVHKLVFLVFLRMSTYKESKLDHITPHVFGELIYDGYIFDVPRMMDICVLYGFRNQQIISKMIQNLFTTQPSYVDDLQECITVMLQVFDVVKEQLGLKGSTTAIKKHPRSLEDCDISKLHSLPLAKLQDIVNYFTDTCATFYCFLEAYPLAGISFYKCGTSTKIPPFYELIFPILEDELRLRKTSDASEKYISVISRKLMFSKSFLVRAFRNIVTCSCIDPALNARCESANTSNNAEDFHLENYLQLFTEIATEKVFLNDYNQLFPFSDDLTMFSEAGINIDVTSLDYILSSVSNVNGTVQQREPATVTRKVSTEVPSTRKITSMQELASSLNSSCSQAKNGDINFYGGGATPSKPENVEILSLIQMILDVLPDYGEGFLEVCLEYYNFDFERVIDALVTDSLPPQLTSLDKHMKRKTTEAIEPQGPVSLLEARKSIFDHDEFDVFNRSDVDVNRIHLGKSGKTPSQYKDFSTDEDSALLKELTLKCEVELEDEKNFGVDPLIYEDEYDDTYDSHPVNLFEPQPENELLRIRPFTTPAALKTFQKKGKDIADEEEEDEERDEEENEDDGENLKTQVGIGLKEPKDEFCMDPEVLRRAAEERYQARLKNQAMKSRSEGNYQGKPRPANFKNKEQHKGQIGNHNRRKQSDYKKSRGMVPFPTR